MAHVVLRAAGLPSGRIAKVGKLSRNVTFFMKPILYTAALFTLLPAADDVVSRLGHSCSGREVGGILSQSCVVHISTCPG